MSVDAKNSILPFVQVGFWALFVWWMLGIAKSVNLPDWVVPVGGVLGLTNLALFAYGLWQRRASNPDNPNNA